MVQLLVIHASDISIPCPAWIVFTNHQGALKTERFPADDLREEFNRVDDCMIINRSQNTGHGFNEQMELRF